jgi:hypothetical protein
MPGTQTKLSIKVHPGARKNAVIGVSEGIWEVRVAAPPVQNKANLELIEFLSQSLGLGKSAVTIMKGHTSRHKLVLIDGLSQSQVIERLTSFSSGTATRQ